MDPLKLTCSQQLWLHSSVGRALHRYRRGHGFESRWSLNFFFFRLLFRNCLNCVSTAKIFHNVKEIIARISKASQALGRLRTRVLNQHSIKMTTKLLVYRAITLSFVLYGCESWTLCKRHIKQLEAFHMSSLRSILKIRWQDKVPNLEALERANTTSIEAMNLKAQLRLTGHVIRMDESRIPRQLLYRPRLRYENLINLTCSMRTFTQRSLRLHPVTK